MLPADTVSDRIAGVLSCLARDHRTGGVLFLDLRAELLHGLARWLAAALTGGGKHPRTFVLGAEENDDTLWWRVGAGAIPVPGPLVDQRDAPLIAVVPDLSRAGLAVTRAATGLAGADWAVADRYGLHAEWQPRSRWLAACASSDVERLSPHLLDRFPVRVAAGGFGAQPHDPDGLLASLEDDSADVQLPGLPPPAFLTGAVPTLTAGTARQIIDLVGAAPTPHRRDLALGRAARTVAISDRSATVEPRHAHRAAELLGLVAPQPDPPADGHTKMETPESPVSESAPETDVHDPEVADDLDEVVPSHESTGTLTASELAPAPVPSSASPQQLYPEDRPTALPDFASLRPAWRRPEGRRTRRGPIIGNEPSLRPVDIAYVATILEAAKFRVRRYGKGSPLRIHPSDLRSHRRMPLPDAALVLLLDHSCRRDWDIAAALAPYLRWAYAKRAALSLVELGHADAAHRLRAERSRPSGPLDGLMTEALARHPGQATPLAHGIDLAVQEMRLSLRNLPIRDGESWLVVVSDGRGNVPLEASQRDTVPHAVGRRGIQDALQAAAEVPGLRRVRAVVLAPPQLSHYRDLPFALAAAMDGIVARPADAP